MKKSTRKTGGNPSGINSRQNVIISLLVLGIIGLLYVTTRMGGSPGGSVELRHIHGLGFSSNGEELFVPAHDGLLVFANDHWQSPNLPRHDYMGYTATNDGFYSSGHPETGSSLSNPLGLVKSADGGKTLQPLAFAGENDFHLMSAGYVNHAIYIFNPSPNSRLSAGLYYTLDDGQTWEPWAAHGISGRLIQIAVHPTEANTVAVAAEDGAFLSRDNGNTFARITDIIPLTAIAFDPGGARLLTGYRSIYVYDLLNEKISELQTPPLAGEDAISYIAANPVFNQIAFATFNKDIYLSQDGGQSWETIAKQGYGGS